MTPAFMRAAAPVRVIRRIAAALERRNAPPPPPDLPSHEQLRESREHCRHAAAAPHILAVGGRLDIIRIPR